MSKYNNKRFRMMINERELYFASRLEYYRYLELELLERAGEITFTLFQPRIVLIPAFTFRGQKQRAITYTADFLYYDNAARTYILEDVKSPPTAKKEAFRLRWKLLLLTIINHPERVIENTEVTLAQVTPLLYIPKGSGAPKNTL